MNNTVIDGGLLWIDFHIHKGHQLNASYLEFDQAISLKETEYKKIMHFSLPIGQDVPEKGINMFQINENVMGISYYTYLDQIVNEVNIISLVWLTTRLFNPYLLIPSLKKIINGILTNELVLDQQNLMQIVKYIKEHNGSLNMNLQGFELVSTQLPPNLDEMNIKFLH